MAGTPRNRAKFDPRWNKGYYGTGLHAGTKYSGRFGQNGMKSITMVVIGNPYYTMRYVVVIGNHLFHIELYCCNRLNLYFTSNFVDVIEVSN